MCGLVGVVSKAYNGFTPKEKDVFNDLLFIDTLRGEDSTGVFLVDNDGNLDLAKEATEATFFQATTEYKALVNKAFSRGAAMIGHNRKATRGVINDENAHPFVVDDRIVLVHNGTLYGDHKKIADVEVDSHAIAHLIHKHEDNVEEALREINGAFALIWYDVQKRTLNFVRNSQRPLAFVETSTCWMWASEPGMLAWVGGRHAMSTAPGTTVRLLEEGELVSFVREGNRWKMESKKVNLTRPNNVFQQNGLEAGQRAYQDYLASRYPYHYAQNDDDDASFPPPIVREDKLSLPAPSDKNIRVRLRPGELELAQKERFNISHNTFSRTAAGYPKGSFFPGKVFDYDFVKGDNAFNGIYLYANGIDEPDILVRCYVRCPPDMSAMEFEQSCLNLATAETKCMFKLVQHGWHPYPGTSNEGFGMFYSLEYGVVKEINNAEEAGACS